MTGASASGAGAAPTGSAARHPGRGDFALTLVVGVLAAVLAAVSCAKPWAALAGSAARAVPSGAPELTGAGQVPVAAALALVVLAAWGAVLVTRGVVRTGTAALGLLASLAMLGVTVRGAWGAPAEVRSAIAGMVGGAARAADVQVDRTGWFWVALVASVVCVAAFVRAVTRVRAWPTMSARYDAPTAGPRSRGDADVERPRTQRDWWQAIDEGRDPTAPPDR